MIDVVWGGLASLLLVALYIVPKPKKTKENTYTWGKKINKIGDLWK